MVRSTTHLKIEYLTFLSFLLKQQNARKIEPSPRSPRNVFNKTIRTPNHNIYDDFLNEFGNIQPTFSPLNILLTNSESGLDSSWAKSPQPTTSNHGPAMTHDDNLNRFSEISNFSTDNPKLNAVRKELSGVCEKSIQPSPNQIVLPDPHANIEPTFSPLNILLTNPESGLEPSWAQSPHPKNSNHRASKTHEDPPNRISRVSNFSTGNPKIKAHRKEMSGLCEKSIQSSLNQPLLPDPHANNVCKLTSPNTFSSIISQSEHFRNQAKLSHLKERPLNKGED